MADKDQPAEGKKKRRPVLASSSPEKVARARRQRSRRVSGRSLAAQATAKQNSSVRRMLRYGLWIVAILVVLGIRFGSKEQQVRAPDIAPQGELFHVEAPQELLGCQAVEARLAPLEFLEEGSKLAQRTQADVAASLRLPVEIENSIGMRFRLIPGGQYVMGSTEKQEGREADETEHVAAIPRHYYMGKFEVTQGQWDAVLGGESNPSDRMQRGTDRPVEGVTWHDCNRFVKALCELEELPVGTYRLPLEREWEYACRGGTLSAYHCLEGELWRFANFQEEGPGETLVVGTLRANAWGLYNMHGNVWEWCFEKFSEYGSLETDPLQRVIRGGNWYITRADCRSASRYRLPPDSKGNICGFRIVRLLTRTQLGL